MIMLYAIFFAYISDKIEYIGLDQEKHLNEFKQYKDMFDCLQEGILVIKQSALEQGKNKIFFANDIANRILQKVFKIKEHVKSDRSWNQNRLTNLKVFYEYKSANTTVDQDEDIDL